MPTLHLLASSRYGAPFVPSTNYSLSLSEPDKSDSLSVSPKDPKSFSKDPKRTRLVLFVFFWPPNSVWIRVAPLWASNNALYEEEKRNREREREREREEGGEKREREVRSLTG